MTSSAAADCPFCQGVGGELLWQDDVLRVVLADEPGYPGFCRVILNTHVAEMTDLDEGRAARLIAATLGVERALRAVMRPDKVNLASLGNQVAHLHWHVIPRYLDDPHFPSPVWANAARVADAAQLAARAERARGLREAVCRALDGPERH